MGTIISRLDIQSRMLYTLLAFCFVAHLNDTPTPGSFQEPGAVFLGLPHRISETAPFFLQLFRHFACARLSGLILKL